MHVETEEIATLVDRVASLDDAPDRALHHWFYVDLARVAAEWWDEATDDRDHAPARRGGIA